MMFSKIASNPRLGSMIPIIAWCLIVLSGAWVVLGQSLMTLWIMWTTDPLRSIGLLIPLATAYLIWQLRREIQWGRGNALGILVMFLPLLMQGLSGQALMLVVPVRATVINVLLTPPGVMCFCYWSGVCILTGGFSAWSQLRFPLGLLLLVNPVPSVLSRFDLNLQIIAASVARGFAAWIHVPVDDGVLRMMFAPNLGMFIAPGCDGMRGMAAMMVLSLIIGYQHRLKIAAQCGFVIGSISLGYLLNLLRLCVVVVYYRIALSWTAIGAYGAEVDYVIGGCIFFAACLFMFYAPKLLKNRLSANTQSASLGEHSPSATPVEWHMTASERVKDVRLWSMGVLAALIVLVAWFKSPVIDPRDQLAEAARVQILPSQSGEFHLTDQRWKIQQANGVIEEGGWYEDEVEPASSMPVQLDFYRQASMDHNGLYCYLMQGEKVVRSELVTLSAHNALDTQPVIVLVALTRSESLSRWVLVTECFSQKCVERSTDFALNFGALGWDPASVFSRHAYEAVVPMSISVSVNTTADTRDILEYKAHQKLLRFAEQFNFSVAQHLALVASRTRQ